jgi:hypothetical protein
VGAFTFRVASAGYKVLAFEGNTEIDTSYIVCGVLAPATPGMLFT